MQGGVASRKAMVNKQYTQNCPGWHNPVALCGCGYQTDSDIDTCGYSSLGFNVEQTHLVSQDKNKLYRKTCPRGEEME